MVLVEEEEALAVVDDDFFVFVHFWLFFVLESDGWPSSSFDIISPLNLSAVRSLCSDKGWPWGLALFTVDKLPERPKR